MSFLKNRTVVGVICILLSLLICFGLTPLFNQSVSQKAEIVRVVQPIRAGDEITESMVQIVEVGGYNLPEDVLRQKESAVGKSEGWTRYGADGEEILSSHRYRALGNAIALPCAEYIMAGIAEALTKGGANDSI